MNTMNIILLAAFIIGMHGARTWVGRLFYIGCLFTLAYC